ncbi:hypothetical protein KW807_00470 [Candidatus Parcubacteria bacterium]|nr:hypothetical protein [Candidatus Parcubacteria bacterium]
MMKEQQITLFVDTGKESINALEGVIHIPNGVNIHDVSIGNSSILIWVSRPVVDKEKETITFSGITPGGFSGKSPVLTLSGEIGPEDLYGFTFSEVKALRNDGQATMVPAKLSFSQSQTKSDTEMPEPFRVIIAKSNEIFNGKSFISFEAQDKGSGVDHYEFASTGLIRPRDSEWQVITSPYELGEKDLFKQVFVKAVDESGNYRVVSTPGTYWYATVLIGLIIIICLASYLRKFFSSRS